MDLPTLKPPRGAKIIGSNNAWNRYSLPTSLSLATAVITTATVTVDVETRARSRSIQRKTLEAGWPVIIRLNVDGHDQRQSRTWRNTAYADHVLVAWTNRRSNEMGR